MLQSGKGSGGLVVRKRRRKLSLQLTIESADPGERLDPNRSGTRTHWVRKTWPCLVVLAVSVLGAFAQPQSRSLPSFPPLVDNSAHQVSAHELQIPRKARDTFNKGTQLLAANELAAGMAELQRAIKIFPDFYEAYYNIGLANLDLQHYAEAQAAFTTSIELSKGRYSWPQFGLGVVLCIQKQYAEAERAVRAGLDQYPADPDANLVLAWVLFSAGRLPEAERSARQAILGNAKLSMAYLLLAKIHLRQSDMRALVSDLNEYLRLDPDGAENTQARAMRVEAEQVLAEQQRESAATIAQAPTP
jgi:tetratricopeptide (TPR) repeat protein